MTIVIHQASDADVRYVTDHIYVPDAVEIKFATNGMPVFEALTLSCQASCAAGGMGAFACHPVFDGVESDAVALFGCVKGGDFGVLWMVTTPMLMSTSKDILKTAPLWIRQWAKQYPQGLQNIIHAGNKRHVRWLKRMGATFDGACIRNKAGFLHFTFPPINNTSLLQVN